MKRIVKTNETIADIMRDLVEQCGFCKANSTDEYGLRCAPDCICRNNCREVIIEVREKPKG